MKKYYLKLCLMLGTFVSLSQTAQMDINSIRANLLPNGLFFSDSNATSAGFEALKDSGTHTIYSTSLWLAGINSNNELRVASAQYDNGVNNSYSTGPLTVVPGSGGGVKKDFGPAEIDPATINKWNKVVTITKYEVEKFKQYFACAQDPLCNQNVLYPGYVVPDVIKNWGDIAHGDVNQFQDFYLAPFYDKDLDGVYDYTKGDFPCIKGDKYAFFIMNDRGGADTTRNSIGVEIHVEVYAFDKDLANPLDRTIFVGYDIINRSTDSYTDFYASVFADFDIGCSFDDYIGSMPTLNSFFGYNADSNDEGCSSSSLPFGLKPPTQGITVLNKTLNSAVFSSSRGTNINTYYNFMQGKHGNGSPIIHYNGDTVRFEYNETGHGTTPAWTKREPNGPGSSPSQIGDVKGIGSVGPFNFLPGDVIELDVAYTYSRADTGDNLSSIVKLQQEIPLVQAFYNDSILHCSDSLIGVVGVNQLLGDYISVYPNPFSNYFKIDLKGENINADLSIIDVYGKIIYKENLSLKNKRINLSGFAKGIYFLKITTHKNEYLIKKLIKH